MHITSWGKDQNPRLKVRFLLNAHCIYIIVKSKNCKPKCCKLGTIYSAFSPAFPVAISHYFTAFLGSECILSMPLFSPS